MLNDINIIKNKNDKETIIAKKFDNEKRLKKIKNYFLLILLLFIYY